MNTKTLKVLRGIAKRIPEKYLEKLMRPQPMAPTVKLIAKKALKDKDIPEETKRRLKNVIDAGHLDKTEEAVDPKIEAKIDKWLEKEVDKAIKEGKIPHPKNDKEANNYHKKLWKNTSKNTKKK